jgi:outer membrane protein OmpA-like peptidoglycan-associated protein
MKQFNIRTILFLIAITLLAACSSEPKVTDFKSTADPQIEISRAEDKINLSKVNQVDVLSPKNFKLSVQALNEAKVARSDNKTQAFVLHKIALAQAYISKAIEISSRSAEMLSGPTTARRGAMSAQAEIYLPSEFSAADSTFKEFSKEVENNNASITTQEKMILESRYSQIELNSIKKNKLGYAKTTIQKAVDEGAKSLTPETLSLTNKIYAKGDATIELNRNDFVAINEAANEATAASNKLLRMVRNAKGSNEKSPEDFAKQIEKSNQMALLNDSEKELAAEELKKTNSELARSSERNRVLESQVWLKQEFESARNEFSKEEGEIYIQGDKLFLRLNGLSFKNNRAGIDASSYSTLAKVQKIIDNVNPSQVIIEGHTDSTGKKVPNEKLSLARAKAVEEYLISNNDIAQDKVISKGFGFSKPVATNKTAEGRALNRRVDIIISAETKNE